MKAKDIMEPITRFLSPDDTLKDAVNKMKVCRRGEGLVGVKGMMVLDAGGNGVGIVSIKDILGAIIPSYMKASELGEFTWDGMLEQMAEKVADKRVSEFMTKEIITVPENAPLMECVHFMIKHKLQRLPVVDKDNKTVGMVYVRDIYNVLTDVLFEGQEICEL